MTANPPPQHGAPPHGASRIPLARQREDVQQHQHGSDLELLAANRARAPPASPGSQHPHPHQQQSGPSMASPNDAPPSPSQTPQAAASPPSTSTPPTSPPPPFWTAHSRAASYHSLHQQPRPAPITLEDHSSEDQHEQSRGCWAQSVTVDEYSVVSGPTGIGAYVVWHCTVRTLLGGDMRIRKRYSEFDRLRANLIKSFPRATGSIPELPRKSVVSRFRPKFLEHRKNGLNHFMNCVLLNPEFAASPVLKEFIFS